MRVLYFILCVFPASCSLTKQNDIVLIKGHVKNIPASKVYLTDAYKWEVFLDSANYKNDTFSFHINPTNFKPYLASIYFIDANGKRRVLGYLNYLLATADKKYVKTFFVIDIGITTISGT